MSRCDWCDGEGEWSQAYPLAGYGSEYMDCPKCQGSGRMFSWRHVALYFIVVLMIGLAFLLVAWGMPEGPAYHGMNWIWPIV